MIKLITFFENLFFTVKKGGENQDDFADFFLRTSSGKQKEVFRRIIYKANMDQKKYIDKFEKSQAK